MSATNATELQFLRIALSQTDDALLQLIINRVELSQKIGTIKVEEGLNVLDLDREAANRTRLLQLNQGQAPVGLVERIFDLLVDNSAHLQYELKRQAKTEEN